METLSRASAADARAAAPGGGPLSAAASQPTAPLAAPGARLLGCGRDPYVSPDDESAAYRAWNTERGRLPGQATLRVRDGITVTPWFDYLAVSPDELAYLVESSAWRLRAVQRDGADYLAVLDLAG